MSKKKWSGLLAGAVLAFAGSTASAAETLTILWAQWDPANYLQELVKTIKSRVVRSRRNPPWTDFRPASVSSPPRQCYEMGGGDSRARRRFDRGHYVELTDFFKRHE